MRTGPENTWLEMQILSQGMHVNNVLALLGPLVPYLALLCSLLYGSFNYGECPSKVTMERACRVGDPSVARGAPARLREERSESASNMPLIASLMSMSVCSDTQKNFDSVADLF